MTPTATCADCDKAWRGPAAHQRGMVHEDADKHVVWYDDDLDTTEIEDREGTQEDEAPGAVLTAVLFKSAPSAP